MADFVPLDHLNLTFSAAIECVAAIICGERLQAQEVLRQLLYNGRVPSQTIERSGQTFDTPAYIWGGEQWGEALRTGRVRFEYAAYSDDVHGRVIIPKAALKTALDSYGVTAEVKEPKLPDDAGPAIPKKIKTLERNQDISALYTAIRKDKPTETDTEIFNLMRIQEPHLFANRRTGKHKKGIENVTIETIIRKSRRQ